MKTVAKQSVICCALFMAYAASAIAQINLGTVRGTVSDPTGRVIPGVEVTATDTATAAQYKSVTNGSGAYAILELPRGDYTLTAVKDGFQTSTQSGVDMNGGDNKTIDIALKVGSTSEHVEVGSAPPALETTTGAYSETMDANTLIDLPNSANGGPRQSGNYVTMLPGFQMGPIASATQNMDGSVGTYSEAYVNGSSLLAVANYHGWVNGNAFAPEAVAEMKVSTDPMADTGNSGGVSISFVTKSGTNALHGSAYLYQHNTALDSAPEYSTIAPRDQQGEYGFDVGGPIYIPKVYDGRNKSFFWVQYGWYHFVSSTGPSFNGVPTDAWKGGNFADQLGAPIGTDDLGRPVLQGQVYNPYSTRTLADGTVIRDPFPGNVIPPALFSSAASKYQAFFPEPNIAGDPPNNYFVGTGQGTIPIGSSPQRYWQANFDQNIGNRDHIAVAYWYHWTDSLLTSQEPLVLTRYHDLTSGANSVHAGWTHTFSPSLVHVLSAGLDRAIQKDAMNQAFSVGAATIGLNNPLGPNCGPGFAIPRITLGAGDSTYCTTSEGDTNFGINDNWTKSYGHHLTKWGFNLYRYNDNLPLIYDLAAQFLAPQTGLPNQPLCSNCLNTTGFGYASFLMGAVQNASAQGYDFSMPRSLGYGFYVADEYRVTPKVTITYGLRYDVAPTPIQAGGRTSQFSFTLPNAAAGGIPGALTFGGHGPGTLNTDQMAPTEYLTRNFAPKFSIAYQFMPKWVLRGAYSMNYGPPGENNSGYQYVYQQGYYPSFSVVSNNAYSPAYFLDNGFPFPTGVPLYNNFDPTLYNGSSTGYFGKGSDLSPRVQDVHVDIQRELPGRIVVSMNYFGAFVHSLLTPVGTPQNQLNYGTYGNLGNLLTDDINSAAARAANIPIPYAGFVGSVAQALVPFPQYSDIEDQGSNVGFNNYNGGLLQVSKSFADGFSLQFGYNFEKELTNMSNFPGHGGEPQNAYNLGAEKAVGVFNMPQQVSFYYTYALPVGRGKHFNVDNRGLDAVVGGWSVAGVHNYESWFTVNPVTEQSLPTVYANIRPNVVPNTPQKATTCAKFNPFVNDVYLNPGHFVDPAPFTFGNAPLTLEGAQSCPWLNENVTFFKTFSFVEGVKLKIGADFFNLANRHQWAYPNADIDSGAYGVINFQGNSPRSIQANARLTF